MFVVIEYPYIIIPPTLILAKYDAIVLELNFQENNIEGGDKIMKLKYYQLFYKVIVSFGLIPTYYYLLKQWLIFIYIKGMTTHKRNNVSFQAVPI